MAVGVNDCSASDLARHLKSKSILAKSVRQGDIVISDDNVFYVTRVSRVDKHVVLHEVDENDMFLSPEMEVTILDRKITKRVR